MWHFAALHSTAQHFCGTWKPVSGDCIGSEIHGKAHLQAAMPIRSNVIVNSPVFMPTFDTLRGDVYTQQIGYLVSVP